MLKTSWMNKNLKNYLAWIMPKGPNILEDSFTLYASISNIYFRLWFGLENSIYT